MTNRDALIALIANPDPAIHQQGMELARATLGADEALRMAKQTAELRRKTRTAEIVAACAREIIEGGSPAVAWANAIGRRANAEADYRAILRAPLPSTVSEIRTIRTIRPRLFDCNEQSATITAPWQERTPTKPTS